MHNKQKKYFGTSKENVRELGKGIKQGGKILNVGGQALMYTLLLRPPHY